MNWQIKYIEEKYYYQSNTGKTCMMITDLVGIDLISTYKARLERRRETIKQLSKLKHERKIDGRLISSQLTEPSLVEIMKIKDKILQWAEYTAIKEGANLDRKSRFISRVEHPMWVFFKRGNKVELFYYYEGKKLLDFTETKRTKELIMVEEILKSEKLSYILEDGVYFAITDKDKAEIFLRDNDWINRVREAAMKYGKTSAIPVMLFCELQRRYREGNKISFDKTLKRLKKYHPDYQFKAIQ